VDFFTKLATDQFPPPFVNILNQGIGIPIPKSSTSVRPIVLTDTHIKLTSRILLDRSKSYIHAYFGNTQLGVGQRFGMETILHSVQAIRHQHPTWDVLQIDSTNAFNAISRTHALNTIHREFPQLYPYLKAIYGTPTPIWLSVQGESRQVLSQQGARQGEPLSSFFFSIGFQSVIMSTQKALPSGRIFAYIDDVTIIAPPSEIPDAISTFQEQSSLINLQINANKTMILQSTPTSNNTNLTPTLPIQIPPSNILSPVHPDHSKQGISILGTPIGTDNFIQQWLLQKTNDLTTEFNILNLVPHFQTRWLLLWYCLRGKVTYLYRTLPPTHTTLPSTSFAHHVSDLFKTSFTDILSPPHIKNETWWKQAQLPISQGGFGFGFQEDAATAAYLASSTIFIRSITRHRESSTIRYPIFTQHILQLAQQYTSSIPNSFNRPNDMKQWLANFNDIHPNNLQAILSDKMTQHQLNNLLKLLQQHNPKSLPPLITLQNCHAGKFLQAIPYAPTTSFTNQHFQLTIRQRLHLPIDDIIPLIPYCATCKHHIHDSTQHYHHLHTCKANNHIPRHQNLSNCLTTMAKHASITMIIEPQKSFYTAKGNGFRPDFMSVVPFNGTQPSAYDISVTHTSTPSSSEPHPASNQRFKAKTKKYKEACNNRTTTFIPLIFESCGYWRPEVQHFIKICAEKASERLHLPISTLIHRYTTQLSTILHRETATMITALHMRQYKYNMDSCIDQLAQDMASQDMIH
jgi:hypothetical protein